MEMTELNKLKAQENSLREDLYEIYKKIIDIETKEFIEKYKDKYFKRTNINSSTSIIYVKDSSIINRKIDIRSWNLSNMGITFCDCNYINYDGVTDPESKYVEISEEEAKNLISDHLDQFKI